MALTRTRNSPGVEFREIDRSQYGSLTDYSIVNTPVFATGFASKGEDYTCLWINSMKTFVDYYGYPTTDPERFFYHAAAEVIARGGVMLASKLPYYNDSKDAYAYCDYTVDLNPSINTTIKDSLTKVDPNLTSYIKISSKDLVSDYGISEVTDDSTVLDLKGKVLDLAKEYGFTGITSDALTSLHDIKVAADTIYDGVVNSSDTTIDAHELADVKTKINKVIYYTNNSLNPKISLLPIQDLDGYVVNSKTVPLNSIRIVDVNRNKYGSIDVRYKDESDSTDAWKHKNVECLGIMPVIVSPINAMFFQNIIAHNQIVDAKSENSYEYTKDISEFTPISDFRQFGQITPNSFDAVNMMVQLSSDNIDAYTLSRTVSEMFPKITMTDVNNLADEYLKQIGVVVLKVFADESNDNRINFAVAESFVGSLDQKAVDSSGKSIFIDNVINDSSDFIRLFSNVNTQSAHYKTASTILVQNQVATSLGFNSNQCIKNIDYTESIIQPLTLILDQNKNPLTTSIDLILDAGISNIAQIVHRYPDDEFNWHPTKLNPTTIANTAWQAVVTKFDTFCKNTRKDCMFIADGLRQFCLNGEQKLVRRTAPTTSIASEILPLLKYMPQINSSYTAGYCNWFQIVDDVSGNKMWLPPSIKAVGIYIYCDAYSTTWSAPAGLNRGSVRSAIDCAFNPTGDEAGKIYSQCWNYAVNYPLEGIIIEGQKTMQLQQSAFDRVNVRRLFLRLEKQVMNAARYFVYEHNTAYNRQKFIDSIKPAFEKAKTGNGISEYMIKCDESINTADVIDRNEMRCIIAIKPVKVLEWIICDFICTNQSATVSEIVDTAG